jgi:spore photoproduct lyase
MPSSYQARPAAYFQPEQIILAKGSLDDEYRRAHVKAICDVYPDAEVIQRPDLPHNKIDLDGTDPVHAHYQGKRTLVLGEHRSAVRFSREEGNTCPNYWHFSPYGFCPYDCRYCYLAGTPGVRFSPAVKIFLNLPQILAQIKRVTDEADRPTAFYIGKLQDGLALDPLTGYMRTLVPFFADHPRARMTLLTKSADASNLLDLDHRGHTILSWSLNPPEVCSLFEADTPTVADRIEAMRRCAQAGYPVRAVIMPIIPIVDWGEVYASFIAHLLRRVRLNRITLGAICSYPFARDLMERKLGRQNVISQAITRRTEPKSSDGRLRYSPEQRIQLYGRLIEMIRAVEPSLDIGLCLEDAATFEALGLAGNIGRCNCVL